MHRLLTSRSATRPRTELRVELLASPVLPDVLAPGLRVVFCGTAAGRASAEAGAYYAHPGNYFWRTLHAAGLTPERMLPAEFRRMPGFGLGLTDLAKHHFGNDDELPAGAFDVASLRGKVERWRPRIIAFTSKNAAQALLGPVTAYGLQDSRIGTTRCFVLPSPSGQARRFWSSQPWEALSELVRTHVFRTAVDP